MRGLMLQKSLKDQNSATRRTKSNLDHKRSTTNVKKSLDHEFKSVVEENGADLESSEVISGDCAFNELDGNIDSLTCPLDTLGSEIVAVSELTSSSSSTVTTEAFGALKNESEIPGTGSSETIGSIKADMVITCLIEARVLLSISKGLGHYKSVLDALVTVMVDEFSDDKYEKNGWLNKLLTSNSNLFFLAFMLLSVALAVFVFFLSLGANGIPSGPPPT